MKTPSLDDLKMISGVADNMVPVGICVVVKDSELIYLGPIAHSFVIPGATVYMNPVDHDKMDARMRKMAH